MQSVEIVNDIRECDVKVIRVKAEQMGMMSSWQSYEEVYPDDEK